MDCVIVLPIKLWVGPDVPPSDLGLRVRLAYVVVRGPSNYGK